MPANGAAEARGAVLVTGSSTGIGRACALTLDRLGFTVFAGVRRDEDGERLRRESGGGLVPVRFDVTDEPAVRAAVGAISGSVGGAGLKGLVNNAGVAVWGPLESLPLTALRRQFDVNVFGTVAVTQACLPLLRSGGGRVVNIGSVAGRLALPFLGPYSASKSAMASLTDSLRVELRPWGITVAIIEPGQIDTSIWTRALGPCEGAGNDPPSDGPYDPVVNALRRRAGVRRTRPPEEVARAVAHALTSRRPRPRYVVGRDARRHLALRLLPTPFRDWLMARKLPPYG